MNKEEMEDMIKMVYHCNPEYRKQPLESVRYIIMACIRKALSLGLDPVVATESGSLYFMRGKMALGTALMAALIRKAGHKIIIEKSDKTQCTIRSIRKDTGIEDVCSFTIQDAQEAGLLKSPMWQQYTEIMLYNRCMSKVARKCFSDLFEGSVYTKEELTEIKTTEEKPLRSADKTASTELESGDDSLYISNGPPVKQAGFEVKEAIPSSFKAIPSNLFSFPMKSVLETQGTSFRAPQLNEKPKQEEKHA